MGQLEGKVALITGAGRGIGRVAVFLASNAARSVTAQTMWVDDGSGTVRS